MSVAQQAIARIRAEAVEQRAIPTLFIAAFPLIHNTPRNPVFER
jgi:hypothetical protein